MKINPDFDKEFFSLNILKWLPFIGDNYLTVPTLNKLLIVGESHYYYDNTQESINKVNTFDFTRHVISNHAIKRIVQKTKIFPNLHKALFAKDKINTKKFWSLISYYNFVQRPMKSKKERPTYDDFYNGWITFFEIIKIIKPKTCLFLGVGTFHSLKKAANDVNLKIRDSIKEDKISGTYPRKTILIDQWNYEIELIFIRHTSQYFNWTKWNNYLKVNMKQQLEWLDKRIKH